MSVDVWPVLATATEVDPLWLLVFVGYWAYDRFVDVDEDEPDEWTPEGAAQAMNEGRITTEEQARRAAAAAEAPDGYRDGLEAVDGIGPELSGKIRADHPDPEFIRNASEEELREIHGVGESTASELKKRFS